MKNIFIVIGFLLSINLFAQAEIIPTFIEKWDNSKEYLLAVASAMPEEQYDFKPAAREMSFREQLFHIQDNMLWLSTTHFSTQKYEKKVFDTSRSKAQILLDIQTSFDQARAFVQQASEGELSNKVPFFAGPKSKLQILNLMQDHLTHHRAQIIVYLNLKQIEPPKYVGW
ncbi:DinB family protein [Flavobacterium sp. FZUC8N2.13]|uniref:DinB family protein n=1 Tax=Flavobacterium zubiriense TaxID=3138075 RepID=A0ABV4TFP6_9FLAO